MVLCVWFSSIVWTTQTKYVDSNGYKCIYLCAAIISLSWNTKWIGGILESASTAAVGIVCIAFVISGYADLCAWSYLSIAAICVAVSRRLTIPNFDIRSRALPAERSAYVELDCLFSSSFLLETIPISWDTQYRFSNPLGTYVTIHYQTVTFFIFQDSDCYTVMYCSQYYSQYSQKTYSNNP